MPPTPSGYATLFSGIVIAIRSVIKDSGLAELMCTIVRRSDTCIRNEYGKLYDITMNKHMVSGSLQPDRHKCGACFIIAFMRGLSIKTDDPLERYREVLAVIAGLTVLGTLIRGNAHHAANTAIIKFLSTNKGLCFLHCFTMNRVCPLR